MTVLARNSIRFLLVVVAMGILVPRIGVSQEPTVSPDWTLEDSDGQMVHLGELVAQRPTVLFFWATWCPYCKALMPHLQSIRLEYGDSVQVVAMTIRDDDGDPVGYIRENGFDFSLLVDTDEIAKLYDIFATPGVLLLTPERKIVFNLYDLPRPDYPAHIDGSGNRQKAAYRAPYWAARIRSSLDSLIESHYADTPDTRR